MPENTRVKISSVVKNQLPDFIRADFPLAGEFLAQYYTAIENQGSTLDVLQNLDKYVKIDELTDLIDSTNLSGNVGIADNITIGRNSLISAGTKVFKNFPENSKIGGYPARILYDWQKIQVKLNKMLSKIR